jgi:hypothetical protein
LSIKGGRIVPAFEALQALINLTNPFSKVKAKSCKWRCVTGLTANTNALPSTVAGATKVRPPDEYRPKKKLKTHIYSLLSGQFETISGNSLIFGGLRGKTGWCRFKLILPLSGGIEAG